MRHRNKVKKMGRTPSHRAATLMNLASALLTHKQIRTTLAKAKAAQAYVDRLIGYGKSNTVHDRRLAFKLLQNRTLVKQLFDEIAPTYADRNGGYTRVVKLGMRRGDGAPLAVLQLVGFEPFKFGDDSATKTETKKAKKKPVKKAADKVEADAEKTVEKAEETVPESAETEANAKAETTEEAPKKEDGKNDGEEEKK
jgi:large subunit ribosomal protein L17